VSTTIGNLAVVLSANAAGFTAGFASAQKGVTSFVGSLGTMAKSSLAAVGISSLAGVASKAFSGFERAEENKLTFESLLGSGERAKTLMKEISQLGYKSSFAGEFGPAAKELLKFGMGADEVVPLLKQLGDVAAGANVPLGELTRIFASAESRTHLASKQLIALQEAGFPIIDQLSQKLGLTKNSIIQLADQGKIGFGELTEALAHATGEGGNFHGMMEKRGNTTLGVWMRIEEGVGGTISKIGSAIGQALAKVFGFKEGLSGVANFIDTLRESVPSLASGFAQAAEVLHGFYEIGAAVFGGIGSVVSSVFDFIVQVIETFSGGTLADLGKGLEMTALEVEFVFKNIPAIAELMWTKLTLGFTMLGNDIYHLFVVNIPQLLQWLFRNWKGVFIDMYEMTIAIFTNIGKNIYNFFANIPELIAGTVSFKDLWVPLTDGFESAIKEKLVFTERAYTDTEKNLNQKIGELDQDLAKKKEDFFKQRLDQIAKAGQKENQVPTNALDKPNLGELATQKKKAETKRAGAFDFGSKDAYSAILKSQDTQLAPAEKTAQATSTIAKEAKKQTKALESIDEEIANANGFRQGNLDAGFGAGG